MYNIRIEQGGSSFIYIGEILLNERLSYRNEITKMEFYVENIK